MPHPRLLFPALAVLALLAAVPGAAPAAPLGDDAASIDLELPANNGLRAHLETFNGEVTLEIERKGRLVVYEVEGESTESGLKARFGRLGLIDVAFQPTRMETESPPKGCHGPPSRWGEGVFVGTVEFTGEREFVRIEADRVKGTMSDYREGDWRCGPRKRVAAPRDEATLTLTDPRCRCFFLAYHFPERRRQPNAFVAARVERREGMEIGRSTYARAGASAFAFDHAAGTATLRPPGPFSGHGTFERRPHARDRWSGTIRVPLLGADPLTIRAPAYRPRLVRALPGD